MVEKQLRRRGILDERVLDAMSRVPRELFVPESLRAYAYDDGALPIGHGQTISQPFVVATICSLLALEGTNVSSTSARGRDIRPQCSPSSQPMS